MVRKKKNYYQILGVSENATEAEIKKAFRKKARQLHPDRAGQDTTRAFQEVQEAYEVLSDFEKRRAYDAEQRQNEHPRVKVRSYTSPSSPFLSTLLDRCRHPEKQFHLGYLDVYLSKEEVQSGTEIHWSPTIEYPCPWCSNEPLLSLGCPVCQGQGGLMKSLPIRVQLPPGLEHGDRLHIEHYDIHLGVLCLDLTIYTA